jgi:hypothetical protein
MMFNEITVQKICGWHDHERAVISFFFSFTVLTRLRANLLYSKELGHPFKGEAEPNKSTVSRWEPRVPIPTTQPRGPAPLSLSLSQLSTPPSLPPQSCPSRRLANPAASPLPCSRRPLNPTLDFITRSIIRPSHLTQRPARSTDGRVQIGAIRARPSRLLLACWLAPPPQYIATRRARSNGASAPPDPARRRRS